MNSFKKTYDLIVVGAGAAGIMAAIRAAQEGQKVLLLEKLERIGAKLKATGGGRCNLTNTLDNESFMERFGREGRFMSAALEQLDSRALRQFFKDIGVESHAPDGFHVFPSTHDSSTIIDALLAQIRSLDIELLCNRRVKGIEHDGRSVSGVCCFAKEDDRDVLEHFVASNVIIATGGMGYPVLGAEGDGYELAKETGHRVTELYPAMTPLQCKEDWVARCRADTLPKVQLIVDLKKYRKLRATGDLIFTKSGIRGPVVLDFSREITPLLSKMDEVPLKISLTGGLNEEQIRKRIKMHLRYSPRTTTLDLLRTLLPDSVARALCSLAGADPELGISKQAGVSRDRLYKLLAWTPLTITGHEGFRKAMITRGGVSLKDIDPATMQSRRIAGLYFCGEVLNLDGPCGGYNLQWSFASGYLAGSLKGANYRVDFNQDKNSLI
ncbi:NAD(P)/FAD-dependent oxidoreductase [Hydrogenimonas sp.]